MAKVIDATPISVTRIRRSIRIEVLYNPDGTLLRVIAHRWSVAQQAGVDVTTPVYVGPMSFEAAQVPANVVTQLLALAGIIDGADTAP